MHPYLNRLLCLLGLALLLGGCAAKEPLPRFVWPPPPEQPRLEFVGNYYSEKDFKRTDSEAFIESVVGEVNRFAFATPFGIVSDGRGKVYISDIHLHNVRIFDFEAREVSFLTKDPVFATPLGMAIGADGSLYVADGGKGAIFIYGADQRPLGRIADEEHLTNPAYLALGLSGDRLYVSDGKGHRIVVFSTAGEYLFSFGERGNGPGQFYAPQGLAFGPDGNIYVADMFNARVQVLTPEGEYLRDFGERGDQPSQFENPKDLAFDSDGNLYVIDGRRSDVMTYTPEGQLLLVTGSGQPTNAPFGFSAPRSIFIDDNDRIYVAESLGKRFSVWQYLSNAYLEQHPYTDQERQRLLDYMEKQKSEGG